MADVAFTADSGLLAQMRIAARRGARDQPWVWVALFILAAAISGFTMLRDVDPFDEGLMLQAARRVAEGQVPYRDFLWAYGPAQPYLLAALFKLFGVWLLDWRILRVLADASVSLAAYLLVRDRVPLWLALGVWLAVACEMAEPRSANPFPAALLAVLVAVLLASRGGRVVAAGPGGGRGFAAGPDGGLGTLTGPGGGRGTLARPGRGRGVAGAVAGPAVLTALAAAFRLDFALYGLAAVAVALVIRAGWRVAVAFAAGSVGLIVLIYAPFAVADGPASLYHALIGNSLSTGADWTLPFPFVFHAPPGAGVSKAVKHLIDFYVPLLSIMAVGLGALGVAVVRLRGQAWPARLCGLLILGAGALAYLLSRTDEFHAQPLFVVGVIAVALTMAGASRPLSVACGAVLAVLLVHGLANRVSALARPPVETAINVPVADGAQAPPPEARALARMVALVDANVPPGKPIYVVSLRSDLVRVNNPLVYVLAERDNPTSEDFGLLTGAAAQARIVRELSAARPRVIVRWTDPISAQHEPNLRGRSSGVHTLDAWIAAHYRLLARLYHYDVLRLAGT